MRESAFSFKRMSAWRYICVVSTDSCPNDKHSRADEFSACDQISESLPRISIAWTKLDHAVNAIKLRFSDGLRDASSKKMPSVT